MKVPDADCASGAGLEAVFLRGKRGAILDHGKRPRHLSRGALVPQGVPTDRGASAPVLCGPTLRLRSHQASSSSMPTNGNMCLILLR